MKRVPAPGSRINVTADGLAVDTAFLGFTTSPHEECAVEAAVQLAEAHGGHTTVLTVGPPEAEEQLRYAVSVGADAAILVTTDGTDWDPQRTARAIVDAVREAEADGPFDLILFGNESADSGGFQVGIRVARALGRPVVNGAKSLSVADGSGPRRARVGRRAGRVRAAAPGGRRGQGGHQPAAVPDDAGPAGVEEGGGDRRRTRPRRRADSASSRSRRRPEQVSSTRILGNGPDAAAAVVDLLVEIGVLSR